MAINMSFPSAGHHNADSGAVANGFTEFKEMDRFRTKLTAYLDSKNHKYMTDRNEENNSQYQSRIKPVKGDILLDMHLDSASPTATGCGVFVHRNASEGTKAKAKELVDLCSQAMGIANRGVKDETQTNRGKIGILAKGGYTILIEFCFISNINDMKAFHENEDCLVQIVGDWLIRHDENQ